MIVADELKNRENFESARIHASVITGKVRVSTFSFTVSAEDAGSKQAIIAYLPAGRGRALPALSRIAVSVTASNASFGMGAYHSAIPGQGTIAESTTSIGPVVNITANTLAAIGGVPQAAGVPYASLDDIPVIFNAPNGLAVGTVVSGMLLYNVT